MIARLTFPAFAIIATFVVLIPVLTLVSTMIHRALTRYGREDLRIHSTLRLLLLVCPTALPVLWLLSSAIHYNEALERMQSCLFEHGPEMPCIDGVAIVAGISLIVVFAVIRSLGSRPRFQQTQATPEQKSRLRMLRRVADVPSGVALVAINDAPAALFTFGRLRPRIGVDTAFLMTARTQLLAAGIRHEVAHCRHHDVFSHFIVEITLRLNLTRFLLEPIANRWLASRELACDHEAVVSGADPLDLSEAILASARGSFGHACSSGFATLAAHEQRWLELRLSLLALLAEDPVRQRLDWRHRRMPLLSLMGALALCAPHVLTPGLFDHAHHFAESLILASGTL